MTAFHNPRDRVVETTYAPINAPREPLLARYKLPYPPDDWLHSILCGLFAVMLRRLSRHWLFTKRTPSTRQDGVKGSAAVLHITGFGKLDWIDKNFACDLVQEVARELYVFEVAGLFVLSPVMNLSMSFMCSMCGLA